MMNSGVRLSGLDAPPKEANMRSIAVHCSEQPTQPLTPARRFTIIYTQYLHFSVFIGIGRKGAIVNGDSAKDFQPTLHSSH